MNQVNLLRVGNLATVPRSVQKYKFDISHWNTKDVMPSLPLLQPPNSVGFLTFGGIAATTATSKIKLLAPTATKFLPLCRECHRLTSTVISVVGRHWLPICRVKPPLYIRPYHTTSTTAIQTTAAPSCIRPLSLTSKSWQTDWTTTPATSTRRNRLTTSAVVGTAPLLLDMDSTNSLSYTSAIQTLNALQTNAETLAKMRRERPKFVYNNLAESRVYLERSGVSLDDLDKLNIVHVSGTKGKGSTCAFCEAILRQQGLRTGFFSSPHLVSATERIRLDGQPISKSKFTQYFWEVFDKVCRGWAPEERPPYFKFLTILAFNIFLKEDVDVAVIEVGIGGEYDCTNIIRKPVVTGITSLGLDHTSVLGNTISEIAWHKAGIMKRGVATYIDGDQQEEALQVIAERADTIGASRVAVVPDIQAYDWGRFPLLLGLYGQVQQKNASLALVLAKHVLAAIGRGTYPQVCADPDAQITNLVQPFRLSANSALGLRLTDWPGRTQLIDHGQVLYMLDGAHTSESIRACRAWFSIASSLAVKNPSDKIFKVMLFNISGDRDPRPMLQEFLNSGLDLVVFCTNSSGASGPLDQQNFTTTDKIQISRCEHHLHLWTKLQTCQSTSSKDSNVLPDIHTQSFNAAPIPGLIIPSINTSLKWITQGRDPALANADLAMEIHPVPQELKEADQVQVLITGSLHLVGGALSCIQPDGLVERRVDPDLVSNYHNIEEEDHRGTDNDRLL